MLDGLTVACGVIGVAAGLMAVVVAILRLRAERPSAWAQRSRGDAWFSQLARPMPVLLAGVLLAVVSGLLLASADEEDEPAGADTAAGTESVRLLRQLVDEDAQGCAETRPAAGATAALTCTFTDRPMRSLRISLFPTEAALREVEQDQVESAGLRRGKCADGRASRQDWQHGVLICDYGQRGIPPYLQWSRRDSRVVVQAQAVEGASAREVYDWWLKESNGAPANNREPYPDRREQEVLRRTRLARDACDRVSTFKGSSAGLRCSVTGVTYLFIGYYDTREALNQALGDPPGEGSCVPVEEGPEPGRRRYRIGESAAGTRDCHSLGNEDASVVEWTNESTKLYGYATTTGSSGADLARIFAWWRETGQFLTD